MELDKFDEIKEEGTEGTSIVLSTPAPQWDTDLVGHVHYTTGIKFCNNYHIIVVLY